MTSLSKNVERVTPDGRFVVRLTAEGLMIRERRRRLWAGPFDYGVLYLRGVRDQVQPAPKRRPKVTRGLL